MLISNLLAKECFIIRGLVRYYADMCITANDSVWYLRYVKERRDCGIITIKACSACEFKSNGDNILVNTYINVTFQTDEDSDVRIQGYVVCDASAIIINECEANTVDDMRIAASSAERGDYAEIDKKVYTDHIVPLYVIRLWKKRKHIRFFSCYSSSTSIE